MIPIEPNDAQPLRPGLAKAVTLWFVMLLVAVPVGQMASEVRQGEQPQVLTLFAAAPTLDHLTSFEDALDEASVIAKAIRPWIQRGLLTLRQGNRKVVVGRDGWLFYRPSVEHHTGPAIDLSLDEGSPLKAIVAYRDALAERGIELLLVPVPTKVAYHPEQLWPMPLPGQVTYTFDASGGVAATGQLLVNDGFEEWLTRLSERSCDVLDLRRIFAGLRQHRLPGYGYLPYDTHWEPELMEVAASHLAKRLKPGPNDWRQAPDRRASNRGDLCAMLDLPPTQPGLPEVEVRNHPVVDKNGRPWEPDLDADVLLLGDSFTNIYSDPTLGWGRGAGLAEQLALRSGRAIDVIALNDGGVNGTRQALARQRGRLDGKTVVIWQFAARDLTAKAGEWAIVPLPASNQEDGS